MKRFRYICAIFCAIILLVIPVSATTAPTTESVPNTVADSSDPRIANGCHTLDASMTLLGTEQLVDNTSSVFVYEMKSDTLMYSMNADERTYPSSLVKMMTALIAVEYGDLDDIITVRDDIASSIPDDAVSAELQPSEVISLRDLVYCLLVGSANDAAIVIAEHVAGDQTKFVEMMNEYAASVGCTDTVFTNVHGLHDRDQYTTARDTARILVAAMKNPDFATFFTTPYYTVPSTNKSDERYLSSINYLVNMDDLQIYYDPRVTGGRTGVTIDGYRCIAATAEQDGMELVCVVMGSADVLREDGRTTVVYGGFKETSALLDIAFNGFKTVQILYPGQILKQCEVRGGDSDVTIAATDAAFAVLPRSVTTSSLDYRFVDEKPLEAPVKAGEIVATVQIWSGNICVAETNLKTLNSVAVLPSSDELNQGNSANGWLIALFIIIGIVVLTAACLFGIRFVAEIKHKNRERRHRRARRRSH